VNSRLTLGVVYHMPFWQTADGAMWEAEGSFARYIDSLAPYFKEIILAVPVFDVPPQNGTRLQATNVRLAALPYFPGPRQFYPLLPRMYGRLRQFVASCDVVHVRIPTPAAIFAFRFAERMRKPVFSLVVGDYRALAPHLPYRGLKKLLFNTYVEFEERAVSHMTRRALTFANGAALRHKHEADGARVVETKTTTLRASDIGSRADRCQENPVRLLTVSRIDPRKGLRVLPATVARLRDAGADITADIIGPPIGLLGEEESARIAEEATRLGVADRVNLCGALPLDRLMNTYDSYDIFVLPTGPGEGIPRVLLEAMAAGLPVITTGVSGIGSLIRHEQNGLLLADASADVLAAAVRRVIDEPELRQQLIRGGYETARAHTLEQQAAEMMRVVAAHLQVPLTPQEHAA
jgi:glycosyltransferase involved in cell wall biosynthesis